MVSDHLGYTSLDRRNERAANKGGGTEHTMKLIYPAIFTPYFDEGGYDVTVPDLPDCMASGDTLADAIEDAVNQASGVILSIMEKGGEVPPASRRLVKISAPQSFVCKNSRSVRSLCSVLPKSILSGLNFS